jgi:hypothetical protein
MSHAQALSSLLTDNQSQEIKDVKMSLAVYCKQLYRVIASNGYNHVNIPGTLDHIRLLFTQIECPALELKQKYNIIGALESMLLLYKYQENENGSFQENINSILDKVQQLAVLGDKS